MIAPELSVLLHAEVSHNIGMLIRLSQEVHLPVGDAEACVQHALDGDGPVVEATPETDGNQQWGYYVESDQVAMLF